MEMMIEPVGDRGFIIEYGQTIQRDIHLYVMAFCEKLEKDPPEWLVEYIPAFTTVTLFYKEGYSFRHVRKEAAALFQTSSPDKKMGERVVEIPVCYGGEFGPDLEEVARHNGLSTEEVIHYHQSGDYLVYMVGFAPGFPYIGGMSERIATPRKASPRTKIPAGSVGIGGSQTGVYPMETPGGWQLIGRTPLQLFQINNKEPSLLHAGDRIKFTSISPEAFEQWEGNEC